MYGGDVIMWPLPHDRIEPHTATTIVVTGQKRVLVCTLILVGHQIMDRVVLLPFFGSSVARTFGQEVPDNETLRSIAMDHVFEPAQPLRIAAINCGDKPAVVHALFECCPLEETTTEAQIEHIWRRVNAGRSALREELRQ